MRNAGEDKCLNTLLHNYGARGTPDGLILSDDVAAARRHVVASPTHESDRVFAWLPLELPARLRAEVHAAVVAVVRRVDGRA